MSSENNSISTSPSNGQRRDLEDIGKVLDRMESGTDKANARAHEWMDRFDAYLGRMQTGSAAAEVPWMRVSSRG